MSDGTQLGHAMRRRIGAPANAYDEVMSTVHYDSGYHDTRGLNFDRTSKVSASDSFLGPKGYRTGVQENMGSRLVITPSVKMSSPSGNNSPGDIAPGGTFTYEGRHWTPPAVTTSGGAPSQGPGASGATSGLRRLK